MIVSHTALGEGMDMYELMTSGTFGRFLQVVPIALLAGLIYAVCRAAALHRKRPPAWGREAVRLLFVCYLAGLAALVLAPQNLWSDILYFLRTGSFDYGSPPPFSGGINLVPTFVRLLTGELSGLGSWVTEMLVGNFLMFLPLGAFLPFATDRVTGRSIFAVAALVPLAVETVQLAVGRSFDVDDLILNFAGIVCGFFAAKAAAALVQKVRGNVSPSK